MSVEQPILSVLCIAHNQCELLKRCISTVLQQKVRGPWEVVVSDDRSTDGTWDLVRAYADKFSASSHLISDVGTDKNPYYLPQVIAVRCNSDECNPTCVSERCGWNKLNAWRYARGEYMVNIDADDYLLSDDIYQSQIDLLEQHPECSMCQQGVLVLNEGENIAQGKVLLKNEMLHTGVILDTRHICKLGLRNLNQAYMMRRHIEDDMVALYGKFYDDTIITLHNLQYGNIVYLDKAEYAWVQYPKSISHSLSQLDAVILYSVLPIHHAIMIPSLKWKFLEYGMSELVHLMKVLANNTNHNLQKNNFDHVSQFDGFIYKWITFKSRSFFDYLRFRFARYWMLIHHSHTFKYEKCKQKSLNIIWKLLVG